MNPYVVAGYMVYWRFPSEAERLAYVAKPVEQDRVARQLSDDTFWVLTQTNPSAWTRLGGGSVSTPPSSIALTVPAGEVIGGQRIVQVVDGKAFYASHTTLASANCVAGISTAAADLDAPLSIQLAGEIVEPSWNWTAHYPIFLSVDGALTQVAPNTGYQIIVGKPTKPTGMLIDIKQPILLL